ncbi:MAG: cyclodeaminase/cyclohydrolase family protein [Clostridiaceae bacterium]
MLKDMAVQEFVEELSSKSPAPGGGSVAALSGSLASALANMVFNLTIGKKDYNGYDDEIKDRIDSGLAKTGKFKDEFLELMEKDVKAFLELMEAFKMPKANAAEAKERGRKIQEGYVKALEIPLKVAQEALKVFEYIETAARWGNRNASSDAGVAAIMAQSAIEGAILNVRINLASIKDNEYKARIEVECQELLIQGLKRKEEIMEIVG